MSQFSKYIIAGTILILAIFGYSTSSKHGVALDTALHQENGRAALHAYRSKVFDDSQLPPNHANHHGPIYQMLLNSISMDFSTRHFINFFVFIMGLIGFALLSRYYFKDWWWVFACAQFFFYPRIFGHGLTNSVDIPFMVGTIWIHLLFKFYEDKPSWSRTILVTIVLSLTSCIRILGLFFFYHWGFILKKEKREWKYFAASVILGLILIHAFYPKIWHAPFFGLFAAAKVASVKKMGTPWFYDLKWLFFTLPFSVIVGLLLNTIKIKKDWSLWGPILIWLLVPLLLPIILDSYLYNGWRHHFFIYPPLVLLATNGWKKVFFKKLIPIPLIMLFIVAVQVFTLHPYQHSYFNGFYKIFFDKNDKTMERDYAGISYLAALKYIAKKTDKVVQVAARDFSASLNYQVLTPEDKKKIQLTITSDYPPEFEKTLYSLAQQADEAKFIKMANEQKVRNENFIKYQADYFIVTVKPWEKQLPEKPDHIIYGDGRALLYIKKLRP